MMADKKKVGNLLKTARGQIDAILTMMDDDRYCMDISTQLMAAQAVLRRANREVLTAHLASCLQNAKTPEERDEKIRELQTVIEKLV